VLGACPLHLLHPAEAHPDNERIALRHHHVRRRRPVLPRAAQQQVGDLVELHAHV